MNAIVLDHSTFDSDYYVGMLNAKLASMYAGTPKPTKDEAITALLNDASWLAYHGTNSNEGGPFGALIVDFHTEDGVPRVVGMGTNHVAPMHDPSAHAEMTALRDAAKRLGYTDFEGLTLVTSCECCPQCLAAATGTGMEDIYFSATRDDAAKIKFSDADLYRLMAAGGIEMHAQKTDGPSQAEWLNGHAAVVVVPGHDGAPIAFYGDDETLSLNDPTAMPCVQAIRRACEALGVFHLPENALMISSGVPHPLELSAADWARIGRVRDAEHPENPALDSPDKDTTRIRYVTDEPHRMWVRNAAGQVREAAPPEEVWRQINLAPEDRDIPAHHMTEGLKATRLLAFDLWDTLVLGNQREQY